MYINLVEAFAIQNLTVIKWPTSTEIKNELWHVSGRLKHRSNHEDKFDVRDMKKMKDGLWGKYGSTKTKATKLVFDTGSQWIILDMQEFLNYIKSRPKQPFHLEELASGFEWNVIFDKKTIP
jgi:hypothetical protein